jgi:hypothetical protein
MKYIYFHKKKVNISSICKLDYVLIYSSQSFNREFYTDLYCTTDLVSLYYIKNMLFICQI